jgi:hypothetical protein
MCGDWEPKQSNDLLHAVFDTNPALYDRILNDNTEQWHKLNEATIIVRLKDVLKIDAITKAF